MGSSNFEEFIDKYYLYWQRVVPNRDIKKLFSPIWNDVGHVWTRDIFRDVFKTRPEHLNSSEDLINLSMYLEAKTFLQGLLIIEDKISMGHSMEMRVPFLDNDLVDFALKLPVKYKINSLEAAVKIDENQVGDKKGSYFLKTKDGKQILRKVMARYIPEEVTSRAKQGFSAPDASWFKGESISYVKSITMNKHARIYDYLDPSAVQSLVGEHLDGVENKRLFIWCLLYTENFLRKFIN